MKELRVAALAAVFGMGMAVFGVDYGSMSIDELNSMRGTNLPAEERAAFQEAYKAKVQSLPTEERAKYSGKPENASSSGAGTQSRSGARDGSGGGAGKGSGGGGGGNGGGNGSGGGGGKGSGSGGKGGR